MLPKRTKVFKKPHFERVLRQQQLLKKARDQDTEWPSRAEAITFKQAQKKCENCGSPLHLQVDYKTSVARDGSNHIENLRILCGSCNKRAAINQLGFGAMMKFLSKTSSPPPQRLHPLGG